MSIISDFDTEFDHSDKEILTRMAIASIAEVFLVCAAVLLFFVQFRLPLSVSTSATLVFVFAGSILCWKSVLFAEMMLFASLLGTQYVLLGHFPGLLAVFVLVDLFVIISIPNPLGQIPNPLTSIQNPFKKRD